MVDLSIVIPTQGETRRVGFVLESIEIQDLSRAQFEIVLAGNQYNQDLVVIGEAYRRAGLPVRVCFSGRTGANSARNIGLTQASGKWIYFLDDDCALFRTDHLSNLVSVCRSQPEVSLFGGTYSNAEPSSFLDRAYNMVSMLWLGSQIRVRRNRPVFLGGNLVVKRADIGSLKFDESIVYGGAELSLQLGMHNRNLETLFVPEMEVHHSPRLKWKTFFLKAWKQGQSHARLDPKDLLHRVHAAPLLAIGFLKGPKNILDLFFAGIFLCTVRLSNFARVMSRAWT